MRREDPLEESEVCGAEGGAATVQEDAATSRKCSNVASPCSNGCSKGTGAANAGEAVDAVEAVEIVEAALAELDAGRTDAAKARLTAFVTATRRARGA